jgi:Ca2+-binding RTX toxin-like protein
VFADGTVWNRAALLAMATAPTAGNDTFYGDYAANTPSGGAGDDTLSGGGSRRADQVPKVSPLSPNASRVRRA